MALSNYLPNSRISQAGVCTSSTRPASPYEGQVIYETDTDRVLVWNGTAWVDVSTGKTGKPGLVLVKEQTIGTTVSSVEVTGAFSADFNTYRIVISGVTASSSSAFFRLRMANLGNHYSSLYYDLSNGTNTSTNRTNAANDANIGVGGTASTSMSTSFDIHNPFNSNAFTTFNGTYTGGSFAGWFAGSYQVNTSFSSITFLMSSGTITGGTVRVYGYNQ